MPRQIGGKVIAIVIAVLIGIAFATLDLRGFNAQGPGTALVFGLLLILFPNFFATLSSMGVRGCAPADIPPQVFSVLGWVLLVIFCGGLILLKMLHVIDPS